MANKKKIATATTAVALAATLLLGGTFAWQSISQTALNEKEAVINPGGRLHDDFNGENKDVYVENFAEDTIYARVRLDEYFEIVMNKGTGAETTEVVTTDATKGDTSTYLTHKFDDDNTTDTWWNWETGGEKVFMPTFNKNKDSLVADINGTFENDYDDYVEYDENEEAVGTEIYDADSNDEDEVGNDFANLADYSQYIKTVENATHTAKYTENANGLISMDEWFSLYENDEDTDNYWVYDDDGWVYWSSPIESGSATGLLLNGISLGKVMDDSYYYAINVVGQFITADDLGKDDNTGFYDTDAGTLPTDNALTLLKKIGVDVGDITADDDDDNENTNTYKIQIADGIAILNSDDSDGIEISLYNGEEKITENVTYTLSTENATVDGNLLKANEPTMTAPLEKYTITASGDGTETVTADFYMNDSTKHTYKTMYNYYTDNWEQPDKVVSSAYTDDNGDVWICLPDTVTPTPSTYVYSVACIWKYGDDVNNIYYVQAVGYKDWQTLTEYGVKMISGEIETNSTDYYKICDDIATND